MSSPHHDSRTPPPSTAPRPRPPLDVVATYGAGPVDRKGFNPVNSSGIRGGIRPQVAHSSRDCSALTDQLGLDLDLDLLADAATPPVSRAWFQVSPKSSRSSSAVAVKPARSPPHGSVAVPSNSTCRVSGLGDAAQRELAVDVVAAAPRPGGRRWSGRSWSGSSRRRRSRRCAGGRRAARRRCRCEASWTVTSTELASGLLGDGDGAGEVGELAADLATPSGGGP